MAGMFGPPVKHRAVELVGGRADGRQLPIGEMGGKHQGGLAVVRQRHVAVDLLARDDDAVDAVRMRRVPIPDAVELREFGAQTAEIVPDPAQDLIDLGR